jgi:hypothetical protein
VRLQERLRPRTARSQSLVSLGLYLVLWVVLIGRSAVLDPAHTCACAGRGDPGLFLWALEWWPHAITHGIDPFWTSAIWNPAEIDIPATTSVPGLSLLTWPVTATAGSVVSFNLVSLLSPVLGAWFAYRLCRYVTGAWLPSLVGGYVFGFSSYELGQMLGHLHMIPVFLVPAVVHLVLLRMDERITVRRFVVLLAAAFALQVLISTEVLFAGLVFGFLALALAFWLVPARRGAIRDVVPPILLAGGAAALALSPFLYEAFRGLGPQPSLDWPANARLFSADPLNYLSPTPITWVRSGFTDDLATNFNSADGGIATTLSESGAYVGIPLLALSGWFLFRTRARPASRFALALALVIFVASLGAHLHVAEPPSQAARDYSPKIPLPWVAVARLPAFDHLLPVRFAVFIFLIVGVVTAQALALQERRGAWARWLVAGLGVVALLPTFGGSYWSGKATDTPFFADGTYKRYIKRDEILLPFPLLSGDSMVWQADSDWRFRMASGYLSAEIPPDFYSDPVMSNLLSPTGTGAIAPAELPLAIRDFLDRHQVDAVVFDSATRGWWEGVLDRMRLHKSEIGGVVLYRLERRAPYLAWGPEFITERGTRSTSFRWLARPSARIPIVNPLSGSQNVTFSARLARPGPPVPVRIEYPDGATQQLRVGGAEITIRHRFALAPGPHPLAIEVRGPKIVAPRDPRTLFLAVADARVTPAR